jgi:hypothetical protein
MTARPAAIDAPTDQRVLLFGPTGIRRSNDGGGSFQTVRGKAVVKTALNGFDRPVRLRRHGDDPARPTVIPAFRGVAGGYLMRTDDGGKTWAPQLITQERSGLRRRGRRRRRLPARGQRVVPLDAFGRTLRRPLVADDPHGQDQAAQAGARSHLRPAGPCASATKRLPSAR